MLMCSDGMHISLCCVVSAGFTMAEPVAGKLVIGAGVAVLKAAPAAIQNWTKRAEHVDEAQTELDHCAKVVAQLNDEPTDVEALTESLQKLQATIDATKSRTLAQKAAVVAGLEKAGLEKATADAQRAKQHVLDELLLSMSAELKKIAEALQELKGVPNSSFVFVSLCTQQASLWDHWAVLTLCLCRLLMLSCRIQAKKSASVYNIEVSAKYAAANPGHVEAHQTQTAKNFDALNKKAHVSITADEDVNLGNGKFI